MLGQLGFSQISYPNYIQAVFVNEPIQLDGLLNESVWQTVPKISNFTQRELRVNEAASENTHVALAYSEKYLYVAVWCYQSVQAPKIAKELRRDFNDLLDDNFFVLIDTYADKRNAFVFYTNPNAARGDYQVFDNGKTKNLNWNGVWDVKTQVSDTLWCIEMQIPFSTLKFEDKGTALKWSINFERNIRHKREQVLWQGWGRDSKLDLVTRAGNLTGLEKVKSKSFVEIKPYGIAGASIDRNKETKELINTGLDVNYLIKPTYRLNVTLNTDFAQVESDRQQINLTRFPLFFPELREFFLEGQDFFDMGFGGDRIVPFYTRRIGLDSNFQPVPIIGGARLLGKENNTTLGAMSLQTGNLDGSGTDNFSVFSVRQDVGVQSTVGMMSVNKINQDGWHTTTGGNFRYSTSSFLNNKNVNLGGAYIQTHNSGNALNTNAFAYRFFAQFPNDFVNIMMSTQKSPADFAPEVALMRRTNFEEFFVLINLRPRPARDGKLAWIRQFDFNPLLLTYTIYNDTRAIQSFNYGLRALGFETTKGERFTFDYEINAEGLNKAFAIRPNIVIDSGQYWFNRYVLSFNSFSGRTFSVQINASTGEFFQGKGNSLVGALVWRVSKFASLSANYEYNNGILPQGQFETNLIGARLNYAFNPNLFGLLFGQWNNNSNDMIFNYRLQWIPFPGADFFFIVNQNFNTAGQEFKPNGTAVIGKLIWRWAV